MAHRIASRLLVRASIHGLSLLSLLDPAVAHANPVDAGVRAEKVSMLGRAGQGGTTVPRFARPETLGTAVRGASRVPSTDTLRLTLEEARARALRVNPDLRAARLNMPIARGALRQASLLIRSNPSADLLTRGMGTEIGVTQEIEIAGQRGARRDAARAGVDRATASVLNVARLTFGDVDRAFYRAAASTQRAQLTAEVLALNRRLFDVAARQLAMGRISPLEYNLAIVESGRSQARALGAERERDQAGQQLRRLLGLSPHQPITAVIPPSALPVIGTTDSGARSVQSVPRNAMPDAMPVPVSGTPTDSLDVDSLTALALRRRPDLQERTAAAAQARGLASVARREAFPNLALRGSSERLESTGDRILRPGIGLTLPVFNRNQGEVEARRAEAEQADLERAAIVIGVRSSVATAVGAYAKASAEARVLETTVLAPARENRRLLEIAFREGKVGLPVLLLIRNQVIDAELEYWQAWLAEREALADLVEATGELVAPALAPATLTPAPDGSDATRR